MNFSNSKKGLFALGRLKVGERNKTEAAYEGVLKLQLMAGEILWYAFEGIKLRLADNTFLTVDFAVMNKESVIELVDVKGSKAIFSDDARVKMKVAASLYPFIIKAAYPIAKKHGGGWEYEVFD